MFKDIALENDGALRKQMDDWQYQNKRGWHVWNPTNYQVGIDFTNKKKKVKEILDILYMLDRELYSRLSVLIGGR